MYNISSGSLVWQDDQWKVDFRALNNVIQAESQDEQELSATKAELIIPQEYEEFTDVFKQPESPELPAYGPHNHIIPLLDNKTPMSKKLYQMLEKELDVLKKYIDEQLRKGNI
jgi:phage terminase large subunit-like protein